MKVSARRSVKVLGGTDRESLSLDEKIRQLLNQSYNFSMKLTSQQTLPVSRDRAWDALNDISVLKGCIPGCESLIDKGDGQYELLIMAAVGPVKAKFTGKLRLVDLQPPHSYTIHFEGSGGPAGHGKGTAEVALEPVDESTTVLHYTATASVGGKIAQIGSRLVDMAAQKMAGDFFSAFDAQLRAQNSAPSNDDATENEVMGSEKTVRTGWISQALNFLRKIFGGK